MIKQFHSIQLKSYALALVLGLVLLSGYVGKNFSFESRLGSFEAGDYFLVSNTYWSIAIQIGCIILGGLLIQSFTVRHEVIFKKTALPLFFFIGLHALFPSHLHFSIFSILSLIGVIMLGQILSMFQHEDPPYLIFVLSLLSGLGSWFFAPYFMFIILVIYAYSRFYPVNFRVLCLSLLGFSFAWLVTFTLNYSKPEIFESYRISLAFCFPYISNYQNLIPFLFSILLIGSSLFIWLGNSFRNTVKIRRIIQILAVFTAITAVLSAVYFCKEALVTQLLFAPASILLAYFFSITKRYKLKLLSFYLFIAFILFNQYSHLLFF